MRNDKEEGPGVGKEGPGVGARGGSEEVTVGVESSQNGEVSIFSSSSTTPVASCSRMRAWMVSPTSKWMGGDMALPTARSNAENSLPDRSVRRGRGATVKIDFSKSIAVIIAEEIKGRRRVWSSRGGSRSLASYG